MNVSFLIITYNNRYLNQCIQSIRQFYKDIIICVVDNDLNSNFNLNSYNVRYSKNSGNNFELGAIWYATKKWTDIDKFIILHNSMILKEKLPEDVLDKKYIPFWIANVADYSPVVPIVEQKLNKYNIQLKYNKVWNSVCGCCCVIETSILKKLIELGLDDLYATNKNEAVSTEILFGYLIHEYLNIYSEPLHTFPIYTYFHKKEKWIWIEKIGSGQGNNDNFGNYNIILSCNIDYNKNNNDLLIDILNYTLSNEELEKNLIESYPKNIQTDNQRLSLILRSIRHRMFTKKYFKDYFNQEYNDIINKKKLIF